MEENNDCNKAKQHKLERQGAVKINATHQNQSGNIADDGLRRTEFWEKLQLAMLQFPFQDGQFEFLLVLKDTHHHDNRRHIKENGDE